MASFHPPRFLVGNRALRELGAGASVSDAGDLANRCSGIQHSRRPSLAWRTAPLPLGEGGPSIEGRRVRVASLFESWDPHPLLRLRPIGLALRALAQRERVELPQFNSFAVSMTAGDLAKIVLTNDGRQLKNFLR